MTTYIEKTEPNKTPAGNLAPLGFHRLRRSVINKNNNLWLSYANALGPYI
jgi:hypothetical protein